MRIALFRCCLTVSLALAGAQALFAQQDPGPEGAGDEQDFQQTVARVSSRDRRRVAFRGATIRTTGSPSASTSR